MEFWFSVVCVFCWVWWFETLKLGKISSVETWERLFLTHDIFKKHLWFSYYHSPLRFMWASFGLVNGEF